jgi:uncharacterized protein (DUF433 family)
MKTLQDQYKLIKEGKGHKGVFLKEAKQMFPNYIRNAATFEEASNILKDKNVISENLVGLEPINTISRKKESYETAFENFLEEARKKNDNDPNAEIKKVSQQVEDKLKHNFDRTDKKNPDNQIFGEIMKGYYCEMKDPKNANKTEGQLRDIVLKNLAKDPIYYTKNGMFGEKGIGVKMDVPGLGEPKEPKGKYKSSGYGDLKESKTNKVESLKEQKVRKMINSMIKQELISENKKYQKTIMEIEKASKLAELTTKMEALDKAIEEKNSRLKSIEESEEMKELVDKKSMRELQKEVKLLEKYKDKVLKIYEKLTKTKKKEVIDENETLSEAPPSVDSAELNKTFKDLDPTVEKVKKSLEDISKINLEEDETIDITSIISKKYPNISKEDIKSFINMHSQDIETKEDAIDQFEEFLTVNPEILNLDEGENELPQEIINQIIPMYAEEGMEIEDIASMYPEMYNEVVEFLEGYDLGLDYDI